MTELWKSKNQLIQIMMGSSSSMLQMIDIDAIAWCPPVAYL